MIIYKVRYAINKWDKHGNWDRGNSFNDSEVIVDNLDTATSLYDKWEKECREYWHEGKYSGFCELMIPHIFENGTIAYWPDEGFIKRFSFGNTEKGK